MERTRGTNQFEQLQLFDPGPRVEPHPGDLRPDQWMSRPDVQYHGVSHDALRRMNRIPMQQSPAMYRHFGTERSAVERIAADNPLVSTGDIYSRRIPGLDTSKQGSSIGREYHRSGLGKALIVNEEAFPPRDEVTGEVIHSEHGAYRYSDTDVAAAKQADMQYESIREIANKEDPSANFAERIAMGKTTLPPDEQLPEKLKDQNVREKVSKLKAGEPVSYINAAEDYGSVSHVVRSDVPRSYAQDVEDSPNRPEHVRNWASRMVAKELTDPSPTISNIRTQKTVQIGGGYQPYGQLSMFRETYGALATPKPMQWVKPDKEG